MPILMAILAAIGGAIWWWARSNPREAIDTASDLVTTAANMPRRLRFRRATNVHPIEGIDDARIAVCAVAQAYIELDDLPTREQRETLHVLTRSRLRFDEEEAQEVEVLSRWLVSQCNGPDQAISLLIRRLKKLGGSDHFPTLVEMLDKLTEGAPSRKQMSALQDLQRAFG